jgi:hypothetical protein
MIECPGVWELRLLLPDERSGHLSYGSKVKVDYFLSVAHGLSKDLESCLTRTSYLIFSSGSPKPWLLHNELDLNELDLNELEHNELELNELELNELELNELEHKLQYCWASTATRRLLCLATYSPPLPPACEVPVPFCPLMPHALLDWYLNADEWTVVLDGRYYCVPLKGKELPPQLIRREGPRHLTAPPISPQTSGEIQDTTHLFNSLPANTKAQETPHDASHAVPFSCIKNHSAPPGLPTWAPKNRHCACM